MENELRVWLSDIEQAIAEIISFLPEKKDFNEFKKDLKTKRAIERNIEIIGEAVGRILKHYPQVTITQARKIVDTRNRIIHGYDTVSEEIIWAIVIRDLPLLKLEVEQLILKL
jgi:uncharacterized protein with HEPN domain